MRLIDKGKTFLDEDDLTKATAMFRDAVNVDPSNGVAYFYLALADAKIGQRDIALGLLDKAEALLGADEEWMAKINDLRSDLGAGVSKPIVSSPIDVGF